MIDTAIIAYGTRTTITFEYGDPVQNGSDGRVVIDIGPVSDAMPTGYRLTCAEGRAWGAPHGMNRTGVAETLEGAIEYTRRHHPELTDLIKVMRHLLIDRCASYIMADPKSPRARRAARRRDRELATWDDAMLLDRITLLIARQVALALGMPQSAHEPGHPDESAMIASEVIALTALLASRAA